MDRRTFLTLMGGKPPWSFGVYNALAAWKTAVGTISEGEKIPVWLFGSSIGTGIAATTPATEGNFQILEPYLESKHGNGGGIVPAAATGWTVTGSGWAGSATFSPYVYSFTGDAGATGTLSRTFTGLSFDILYYTYSDTNTFTVQLDSETPVTMGAVGTGTLTFAKETITAAASGEHTITITPGAGGKVRFWAINVNLETDGVQVNNPSKSGANVGTYFGNSEINCLTTTQPKLTIIALTTNDYNGQTALATYKTRLETMINKALAYGSCLCVAEPHRLDQTKTIKQVEYDNQMKSSALTLGAGFISIPVRWGGYKSVWMDADTVHPNTLGHADISNALKAFL